MAQDGKALKNDRVLPSKKRELSNLCAKRREINV